MKKISYIYNFTTSCIKQHKVLFTSATLLVLLTKFISTLIPVWVGSVIDQAVGSNQTLGDVVNESLVLLGLVALLFVISPMQQYILSKFTQYSVLDFSRTSVAKVLNLDFGFFTNAKIGKVVKTFDRGIETHEKILTYVCEQVLPIAIEVIILLGALAYFTDSKFVAVLVVIAALHIKLSNFIIIKRRSHIEAINDCEDDLGASTTEVLTLAKTLKLEQATSFGVERLYQAFKSYADSAVRLAFSGSILSNLHPLVTNVITLISLVYGVGMVSSQQMSVGEIVTLITLASKFSVMIGSMNQSLRYFDQFSQDYQGFLELTSQASSDSVTKVSNNIESLSINSVDGKSHIFKRGERVAVVGPSGGGKTTLLNQIAGVSEETGSTVYVSGSAAQRVPLEQLNKLELQAQVAFCPQENSLISGTPSESAFFSSSLQQNQVEMLEHLELKSDFLENSKFINERATNLSGGEARRLCLSRTFLKNSVIKLYDEPTTGLNETIRAKVWDTILGNSSNSIVFCTTHELERLKDFDRIIHVKNGEVIKVD